LAYILSSSSAWDREAVLKMTYPEAIEWLHFKGFEQWKVKNG